MQHNFGIDAGHRAAIGFGNLALGASIRPFDPVKSRLANHQRRAVPCRDSADGLLAASQAVSVSVGMMAIGLRGCGAHRSDCVP
jgi:hypothetical protein